MALKHKGTEAAAVDQEPKKRKRVGFAATGIILSLPHLFNSSFSSVSLLSAILFYFFIQALHRQIWVRYNPVSYQFKKNTGILVLILHSLLLFILADSGIEPNDCIKIFAGTQFSFYPHFLIVNLFFLNLSQKILLCVYLTVCPINGYM